MHAYTINVTSLKMFANKIVVNTKVIETIQVYWHFFLHFVNEV